MNKKGFTLIEMLIVIAIIAILSGIVLAGVSGFQSRARDTARIADLKNIQNYLELYFNKCGYYPGTVDNSGNCTAGAAPQTWAAMVTLMTGPAAITSQFPTDPNTANGRSFCYGVSSDGLSYALGAVLENDNSVLHAPNNGTAPTGVTFSITGTPACNTNGGTSNTFIVSS